mmetsp:Transcript_7999/g.36293  ORF Transcript_7999/g.36293 Transcript_7999/m.36293 type:complete len:281 (-) Transcript_7999:389-1231(-)
MAFLVSIAVTASNEVSTHRHPPYPSLRSIARKSPKEHANCGATSMESTCGEPRTPCVTARPSNAFAAAFPATDANSALHSSQTQRYRSNLRRCRLDPETVVRLRYRSDAITPARSGAADRGHRLCAFVPGSVRSEPSSARHLIIFSIAPGEIGRETIAGSALVQTLRLAFRVESSRVRFPSSCAFPPQLIGSPCAAHSRSTSRSRANPPPPSSLHRRSSSSETGSPNASNLARSSAESRGASCAARSTSSRVRFPSVTSSPAGLNDVTTLLRRVSAARLR